MFWGDSVSDTISFSAGATAYIYPFADPEVAGTANPFWLEPSAGLHFTWTNLSEVASVDEYFVWCGLNTTLGI